MHETNTFLCPVTSCRLKRGKSLRPIIQNNKAAQNKCSCLKQTWILLSYIKILSFLMFFTSVLSNVSNVTSLTFNK